MAIGQVMPYLAALAATSVASSSLALKYMSASSGETFSSSDAVGEAVAAVGRRRCAPRPGSCRWPAGAKPRLSRRLLRTWLVGEAPDARLGQRGLVARARRPPAAASPGRWGRGWCRCRRDCRARSARRGRLADRSSRLVLPEPGIDPTQADGRQRERQGCCQKLHSSASDCIAVQVLLELPPPPRRNPEDHPDLRTPPSPCRKCPKPRLHGSEYCVESQTSLFG